MKHMFPLILWLKKFFFSRHFTHKLERPQSDCLSQTSLIEDKTFYSISLILALYLLEEFVYIGI